MGTSASNGGPKGTPPLLPDWYIDNSPQGQPIPEQGKEEYDPDQQSENDQSNDDLEPESIAEKPETSQQSKEWGKAKGAMTRLSNNTTGASIRKAAKNYINSLGGSRGATHAAAQGIRTGGHYANFLGDIASGGMDTALTSLGLQEFIGKTFEEICVAIADAIAPPGTTNDEAVAREALILTLDSLYTKIQDEGKDVETLETLGPEQIKETMIEYVSNFVFSKWMYELGNAIEKGAVTEAEAIELEKEVKELIFVETAEQYRETPSESFDLNNRSSKAMIENIFLTAYSTLES